MGIFQDALELDPSAFKPRTGHTFDHKFMRFSMRDLYDNPTSADIEHERAQMEYYLDYIRPMGRAAAERENQIIMEVINARP